MFELTNEELKNLNGGAMQHVGGQQAGAGLQQDQGALPQGDRPDREDDEAKGPWRMICGVGLFR